MNYYVSYLINGNFKVYVSKNFANIEGFIKDVKINEAKINIQLIDHEPKLYNPLFIKMEAEKLENQAKNYQRFLKHVQLVQKNII
jgi:hypothetical protein